jgi:hypothetical protein
VDPLVALVSALEVDLDPQLEFLDSLLELPAARGIGDKPGPTKEGTPSGGGIGIPCRNCGPYKFH